MMSKEGKEEIMGLKESLRGVFNGRTCQNWAVLLFYVKQVSFHNYKHNVWQTYMKEPHTPHRNQSFNMYSKISFFIARLPCSRTI